MKGKKLICAAAAVALTLGATMTGCVATINEEDLKQKIAVVNITKSESFSASFTDDRYASAIYDENILKSDLLSSFLSYGYQYVNYGYSYRDTFELIVSNLTSNAVVAQYATVSVLKNKVDAGELTIEKFKEEADKGEKEMYTYLLGGEESEGVSRAKYSLYSSLNSGLDSYEEDILKEEDEYKGTASRAVPTGIDTIKDEFIPEGYGVYTGYENYLLSQAGDYYEPLNGTSKNTRRKAYARFISYLKSNYLITSKDEGTTDILQLSYVQDSYVSQLRQQVIDEFNETFEKEQEKLLTTIDGETDKYTFIEKAYNGLDGEYTKQANTYDDVTSFESAFGSYNASSFILYSPDTTKDTEAQTTAEGTTYGTYGYVYNILLPFSTMQDVRNTQLQSYLNKDIISEDDYYYERNQLLRKIETTDQRGAWFNGTVDYSFDGTDVELNVTDAQGNALYMYTGGDADRKYLFFENNLTKPDEYEQLDKYIGAYTYNGKVTKNTDGSYKLVPKKLDIDGMLSEFSSYINYVLGTTSAVKVNAGDVYDAATAKTDKNFTDFNTAYYENREFVDDEDMVDYGKLVYATGKVELEDVSKEKRFVKSEAQYKAMSAVNELQYAYTTDTGVLSQYIGYSVTAYETSFIKEFEYAAQQALRMGVGAFKVCAGSYGWHLIYVTDTFSFNGGEAYTPDWSKTQVETEGTFENLFYEWVKGTVLTNEANIKRDEILHDYNVEKAVTVYRNAYKDLAGLN